MTATVAIIVPVLGRPHLAKPFMESLQANTPKGKVQVYAICEQDRMEDFEAWDEAGALTLIGPLHTFAEKVDAGYASTSEPLVLLLGSDVIFRPWWYETLMKVADKGFGLVATNDLGNPRVMAGTHATHPLISRRYIEEKGASWDGPGTIVHTGYRHQNVDDEWTTKARLDGEFAFARKSIVEHCHPFWDKAEMDWVYEKGQESADADRALFLSRLKKYTNLLDGADA